MAEAFRYTKEALELSFKLLEINPESYTTWNYRKLAFQHNVKELSDPEAIKSAVDDELRVVSSLTNQHLYQLEVGLFCLCALVVYGTHYNCLL